MVKFLTILTLIILPASGYAATFKLKCEHTGPSWYLDGISMEKSLDEDYGFNTYLVSEAEVPLVIDSDEELEREKKIHNSLSWTKIDNTFFGSGVVEEDGISLLLSVVLNEKRELITGSTLIEDQVINLTMVSNCKKIK